MIKIQNVWAAALIATTIFSASCSSEEPIVRQTAETDPFDITISEESYIASQSRATWQERTDTSRLDNGWLAEVSVQRDTEEDLRPTRAAIASGHYTIYALDASNTRVGTMTGTVSSGKFVRDAFSARLRLSPGTYTFVCINDAVQDNGTSIQIDNASVNPMMGITTPQAITGSNWKVSFTMKHLAARMRFRIVAYTDHAEDLKANLFSMPAIHATCTYDLDGSNPQYTTANTVLPHTAYTLSNTPAGKHDKYVLAHTFLTNYCYFVPTSFSATDKPSFQITTGKLYSEQLSGKYTRFNVTTLNRNDSYTVTIRLRPNAIYLFNDGTNGVLAEKGSRTPIGIVSKEKTNTEDGTAAALSPVSTTLKYEWGKRGAVQENQPAPYAMTPAGILQATQNEDGYKNTWDASHDGSTIKGNEATDYPVFYQAGHYGNQLQTAGVTLSGGMENRKWFLPSTKDWMQLFGSDGSNGISMPSPKYDFFQAMRAAGGTYPTGYTTVASSTELIGYGTIVSFGIYTNYSPGAFAITTHGKLMKYIVHPFVHF